MKDMDIIHSHPVVGSPRREFVQTVDITVTECVGAEASRRDSLYSNPELGLPRLGEDLSEVPDRISPLGFKDYIRDRIRSNSLPGSRFLESAALYRASHEVGDGYDRTNSAIGNSNMSTSQKIQRPHALHIEHSRTSPDPEFDIGDSRAGPSRRRVNSQPAILTESVFSETAELCEEISRFHLFKPIPISSCLSPTRTPCSSRPGSPCLSTRSLSPVCPDRPRLRSLSCRSSGTLIGSSRLPRDSVQPMHGSITNLSDRQTPDDDEEHDSFSLTLLPRQRSSTCPDNRSWNRRRRVKVLNRPATPPPLTELRVPQMQWPRRKSTGSDIPEHVVGDISRN